jgi:hypothetical protein
MESSAHDAVLKNVDFVKREEVLSASFEIVSEPKTKLTSKGRYRWLQLVELLLKDV